MRVQVPIEVGPKERAAIGRALGTAKAAPEEGVRSWAQGVLRDQLRELTSGEVLETASAAAAAEWRAFDYDDKAATAPKRNGLVWIIVADLPDGVDVGYFDGHTFRTWWGSDDCYITHWAPITRPGMPEEGRDAGA